MYSEAEKRLRSFFAEEGNIRLAFLMGSFAKGTARPDSDVDVAVLFGRPFGPEDVLELKGRLEKLLERDVDIVVLDRAGPVIRMQALKTGILLASEKGAYEEFFTATVNEYDDLKYNRREIEESLLRRRHYA